MSDGELKPGDGLLLKAFTDFVSDTCQMSYKTPTKSADGKPRYHLAMWLGLWHDGAANVDERLNHLGWVYDPEAAQAAIAKATGNAS